MEEAFFLCYTLKCLKIAGEHKHPKDDNELWQYMTSQKAAFPVFYKAYSHLRTKNWVVRPGHQYGEDFVAYRHLPSVVKTLLVLTISKNGDDAASPSCLANYTVEERTVTRWSPEQSREEDTTDHVESQAID
ncbi:hypothetical protein ACFXTI_029468 [Malus domestica]